LESPHKKRRWLSMVATLLPMVELQKLGWKIDSHTFRTARNHCNEFGPGAPVPKPKQPLKKQKNLLLPPLVSDFFHSDEITREGHKSIAKNRYGLTFFNFFRSYMKKGFN
jgi:hypothetical protein